MYDILVIGGGVVGGMILRELARYDAKVCLLEKEDDVAMGASRSNSGISHAGFDAAEGSKKAKFNVLGASLMPEVCKELGVKYRNNGSLVVGFSDEERETLNTLYNRGIANGVKGLKIIEQDELRSIEPNISDNALCALYATTAGIVCPYELTIASIGNAMDNGAELITNFEVVKIEQGDYFTVTGADGRQLTAKYVINCAGLYSDKVANMIGDNSFKIGARKGEYIILDKESGDFVSHTLFFCPTKKGKGILVSQTVDNNIILGPTAVEIEDKSDVSTSSEGFANVIASANRLCKNVPVYNSITSFAGIRAYSDRHDFIIEKSAVNDKFFNVAGIESPGLTSAPAIGQYVAGEVAKDLGLSKKANFNPNRKADYFFKNLSIDEKNALIKEQPEYGKIICRCESITLGEILRAVRENPKATNVDAIKRRTRAGMGRCQGGFCQPVIVGILSKELGIKYEEVTKSGKGSIINIGRTK